MVFSVAVKTPLDTSMRTMSFPPRAKTTISRTWLRLNCQSAEPLLPTSTWILFGLFAFRRRTIVSPAGVPITVATFFLTWPLTFGLVYRFFLGFGFFLCLTTFGFGFGLASAA